MPSLASCYEESLTTILRLSVMPPDLVPDEQRLRSSITDALMAALEQAKRYGHGGDTDRRAFHAIVAFIDETVLGMQNSAFANWPQRMLQVEMFNHNRAGEVFFEDLEWLLARQELTQDIADVIEVFCLCLLLGFQGMFGIPPAVQEYRRNQNVEGYIRRSRQKIDQIRGQAVFMPDEAQPPEVKQATTADGWSRGFVISAVGLLVLTIAAFGVFWMILSSGIRQLS